MKRTRKGFGQDEIAIAKDSASRSVSSDVENADANADQEVLITCLADVIGSKDQLSYNSPDSSKSPEVVIDFAVQPASYPMEVVGILDDLKAEQWQRLAPTLRRKTSEAVGSLARRIASTSIFTDLAAVDRRIQMVSGAYDYSKVSSTSVIQAYRPGFSNDRRCAFVRIALPWSMHIGFVTYVLEWKDGKWIILIRREVYYT